jgi:hypothetical protein
MWGPAYGCYTLEEFSMRIMCAYVFVSLCICVRACVPDRICACLRACVCACSHACVLRCVCARARSHMLAIFLGYLLEVLEFLINVTSEVQIMSVFLLLPLALSSDYVKHFVEGLTRLSLGGTFSSGVRFFRA